MTDSASGLPILEVKDLFVNYDQTPALWDVSFEIPEGLIVGIIGPNGAGKSTLLKALLGLIKPVCGKILFFQKELNEVRKRIAYVPQRESVDWHFPITVRDLVLMGRYGRLGLLRRPKTNDYQDVDIYLKKVGMLEFAERQISQLSGGQQQRTFIARALMQEADIYFLDEPFAGIDLATEAILMKLLRELVSNKKTVFIVHHDLNAIESYFDWLIMLNIHLIANGKRTDVFNAENLAACYGKNYAMLSEAFKL